MRQTIKPGGGAAPVGTGRPRPALFQALGHRSPPAQIEVAGERYGLVEVLKHDSWAATAVYEGCGAARRRIVCKFNREYPILGIPAGWLGRWLAAREADRLERLAPLGAIPAPCGPVKVDGCEQRHAVAHVYVEGQPLRARQRMPDSFYRRLQAILAEMHQQGIAYVDLNKPENIIVGRDGQPYLIDFQISFRLPEGRWGESWPLQALFRMLCASDLYHIRKHELKANWKTLSREEYLCALQRPWWIGLHRLFAAPLREMRRRLLVALRIRCGRGRSESEHAPEHAVRLRLLQPDPGWSREDRITPRRRAA